MQITKYIQSCLLVESDGKVALFDPGMMSEGALDVSKLTQLDSIIITHAHGDHFSMSLMKNLVDAFPKVHITAPSEVVSLLADEGIAATDQVSDGIEFFDAPHESVEPLYPSPEEIGVHYQGVLSHPGDSHSFTETKAVLALPITAPWGSTIKALNLVLELKPEVVVPIHDWHWRDEARIQTYDMFESILADKGITFLKPETGVPLQVDL